MALKLDRPLCVLDLETTSADVATARAVQIGYVILVDGGIAEHREELYINPGVPIEPDATAVHGITDERVKDEPKFEDLAGGILDDLEGCDLAGFNIEKFDLPILTREFAESEIDFPGPGRQVIDVMKIYHRNERRDLTAAVRLYLGCDHAGAHGALADAVATAKVLHMQVERYGLPADTAGLDAYCHEKPADYVDQDGKFHWRGGEVVCAFSKQKGRTLRDLAQNDRGFLNWILRNDFSDEVKTIVRGALNNTFMVRA